VDEFAFNELDEDQGKFKKFKVICEPFFFLLSFFCFSIACGSVLIARNTTLSGCLVSAAFYLHATTRLRL
jgi:hypothetical protein